MKYALRLTSAQHAHVQTHLFPGDGKEAVALLVCGRRAGRERHVFTVCDIILIPYSECDRSSVHVTWKTAVVEDLLPDVATHHQAIVKIHSHPAPVREFSKTDTASDREVFASVISLLDDEMPHASLIMLPDGTIFGRAITRSLEFSPIETISVIGDDLHVWHDQPGAGTDAFAVRHSQAFGRATTSAMRLMSAAIVGCSGTGSIVAEQISRLGVGKIVLIDPDHVEEKNLNRILNTGKEDAALHTLKVHVLAKAIARMGLGQEIVPLAIDLCTSEAVCAVAECDVAFGCMDGAEGRHLLNRVATFYSMPYIDVGVKLEADGKGGIENISGSIHYLQPGKSSLLSRGVYTMREVEAEELRRTDPALYALRRRQGYIHGVEEDRPAVISINMFFAALAVDEFLARIHPYRNQPNSGYAIVRASLAELQFYIESEPEPCPVLQRHLGRGDVAPLLERSSLS